MLRVAVVGVGRMGRFHVDALAEVDEVAVAAVFDTRPENAEAAAAACGAVVCSSLDALLGSGVDAWLIASPTPTHGEIVDMALRNGLHVLCEKPLSLEPDEHDELDALATENDRVLQVGFWRRFSPPWIAAKRLIDEGKIGDPLMVRLSQWDADPPPAEFCDPSVSGGLAVDCGVHEYDLAEWLTGQRITSVAAKNLPIVSPAVAESGDVDNLVATLELDGGSIATADLSRNARYGDDVRTEILGSDGALFVELLPTARLRLATDAGIRTVPESVAEDGTVAGVRNQARVFARAVGGTGRRDGPGASSSKRALQVGRAVQRAAETGKRIEL